MSRTRHRIEQNETKTQWTRPLRCRKLVPKPSCVWLLYVVGQRKYDHVNLCFPNRKFFSGTLPCPARECCSAEQHAIEMYKSITHERRGFALKCIFYSANVFQFTNLLALINLLASTEKSSSCSSYYSSCCSFLEKLTVPRIKMAKKIFFSFENPVANGIRRRFTLHS